VAAAGSPAAPRHPDEQVSHWRYSLASGVLGRWNGFQLDPDRANSGTLLYFGGQADGLWTEGFGHSVRLRLRLLAGGERVIFLPSDGEAEAAYMIGRREFRFVVGRVEVARAPGLALQLLGQVATLPCFEGSVSLASDRVRLYYYISPVEMAWRWYYDRAHIDHQRGWSTEVDHPEAASAFRARVTFLLPPSVLLSLQGDYVKMWGAVDQLVGFEASAGFGILDQSVLFNAAMRWESFARRGLVPSSSESVDQFQGFIVATLVF
jgi:hypothetical protein